MNPESSVYNCDPAASRIVGGELANNSWPFLVNLRSWKSKTQADRQPFSPEICGGAIIDENWVLTGEFTENIGREYLIFFVKAGHCCQEKLEYKEMVFGAMTFDDYKFKIEIKQNQMLLHPKLSFSKTNFFIFF